jgi:hypothetical protein
MDKLKQLFLGRKNGAVAANFSVQAFVKTLNDQGTAVGSVLAVNPGLTQSIGTEAFGDIGGEEANAVADLYSGISDTIRDLGFEAFATQHKIPARVQENQILAASMAAIAAGDEQRYKKALRGMGNAKALGANQFAGNPQLAGPFGSIEVFKDSTGLENYNEKSQRDFRVVTIGYNLTAVRQDPFGEAIYPTSVVNPTEGGVVQILPYAVVMKDVFHAVTGQRLANEEINMVEAFRDPSILEDVSTSLTPVVDEKGTNLNVFVPATLIAPKPVETDHGGTLMTAPLKIGAKFDLIGVSNRNQLVAGNVLDVTDTIDPALKLKSIIVTIQGKAHRFQTDRIPTAVFQPALIGDTRTAQLHFTSEDLVLNGDIRAVDGSTVTGITEFANRKWTARLSVSLSGSISTSKGDCWITATPVIVEKLFDETGDKLDQTAGDAETVLETLGEIVVVGYELDARFTNTNRRERGHLLQTRALQFRYSIPMHAPITLPLSTMDDEGPGEVVKALTVATNIRNSNNAVTRVLNYTAQLKEVVGNGFDRPKFGAVEGALSALMRPTYRYKKLDLVQALDTIRSSDRWDDVTCAIMNCIKSMLFPAYRDSNIEAVFRTVTGNQDERPKFILATDKEIANYLMTSGDDRTIGPYLKYDIVSTNNIRFDGKLLVLPTRENPSENDILSFGQFYYVPTIVADLNISRNGQVSREIAAVPFNLHVNNIPFVLEIDIVGLKEVMGSSLYNSKLG